MAVGQVVSIPNNTHTQQYVPSGVNYPTLAILNPNDGILFVAQNRDAAGTAVGSWEYKVPSQSYAILPGPWQSIGLYYLDQSGTGLAGQVTIYPVPQQIFFPDFHAIGRALSSVGTAVDITEGAQPANPGSGILRLWADGTDILHGLDGAGVDEQIISSRSALGGGLSGNMPSPSLAVQYGASMQGAVTQGMTNATYSILSFNTATVFNRGGVWNAGTPTRFTAPVAGVYLATADVGMTAFTGGTTRQLTLHINGGGPAYYVSTFFSASMNPILNLSFVISLAAGSYVEFGAYQDSGANQNTGVIMQAGLVLLGV